MKLLIDILILIGGFFLVVVTLTIFSVIKEAIFGKNDDNNDKGEEHRPMSIDMGG
jgi:hypothetical protein